MQYWTVVVLCGLTVGKSVTWCRPQVERQLNSRVNMTGTRIHFKISVTVVPAERPSSCSAACQVSENLESLLCVTASLQLVHQMGCPAIRRAGSFPTSKDKALG